MSAFMISSLSRRQAQTTGVPVSSTAGWSGVDSVFKMQTRPVNFPLITLHSSVKGGALHIPFHLCSASETETGVGFERRDKGCSQWRRRRGDSQAEISFFCPQGCELLLLLFPFSLFV